MTCNCRNTDELRIVRGNAFAIRMTVTAIHIDGTPVENFVLGEAEAVLKVMHNDDKTQKDFLVVGNDAVISFDGTQSLGWYGFEMTGTFNGKPWRWCVPKVFQIVETNAKANIPSCRCRPSGMPMMATMLYMQRIARASSYLPPRIPSGWNCVLSLAQ